jgi:peroxiredoxin
MSDSFTINVNVVKLANLNVLTPEGNTFVLGRVWKHQTAILVFLRHFACMACRAHAQQVWDKREEYEKSGGKIIFIGNGAPSYIDKFKKDLNLGDALVLTDPTLEVFNSAGFRRGFFYLVRLKTIITGAKLAIAGYQQKKYTKEAGIHSQLGGVMVINQRGEAIYHYISEYFGDFPEEAHIDIIQKDESTNGNKVS